MSIIGIVAVDRNLAIGKGGKLPWHYSDDMKFFKETTSGNAVVMGRRTWMMLKGPLRNRINIVLSRDTNLQTAESVIAMKSVAEVLDFAKNNESHLFVIGGAKVYEYFRTQIDRWIGTEVPLSVDGADTLMPPGLLSEVNITA